MTPALKNTRPGMVGSQLVADPFPAQNRGDRGAGVANAVGQTRLSRRVYCISRKLGDDVSLQTRDRTLSSLLLPVFAENLATAHRD